MRQARGFLPHFILIIAVCMLLPFAAKAQTDLSPELRGKIDQLANDALAQSGVRALRSRW